MTGKLPIHGLVVAAAALALTASWAPAVAQTTAPDYSTLNPGARNEPATLPEERQTLKSAIRVDLRQNFARLPLHRTKVGGKTAWYVITEVSDEALARRMGLNFSPRLANLITPDCPGCVQTVRSSRMLGRGTVKRPGTVDFSPDRLLVPGANGGFPPAASAVGAVGDPRYSPFVRIAGTDVVYNAPIVATGERGFDIRRHSNTHDRLFDIDVRKRTVDMNFIRAFSHGRDIQYLSFESSSAALAVFDRTTFTPVLGLSPAPDRGRDPATARSVIIAFANGMRGRTSPPGQGTDHVIADGLNARPIDKTDRTLIEALRVGGDAHNVLDSFPTLRDPAQRNLYSPIWDVQVAVWTPQAVAAGLNTTQTDANQIRQLAARGLITSPGGTQLRSDRAILNCPALGFLTVAPEADQAPAPPGQP